MGQQERTNLRTSVCVVGLGYVGLPLAVELERAGHDVIGFDVDPGKIETLCSGVDPTGDVGDEVIVESEIEFTTDETVIERAEYVLVAVPTPVDDLKNPDLKFVESAGETVGRNVSEGTTVVLESTVYPGATREILGPALEKASGLAVGEELFLGYSPERMGPGDEEHGLRNVVKIVSGQNSEVLADVAALYETVVDAGVHRAPEIALAHGDLLPIQQLARMDDDMLRSTTNALPTRLAAKLWKARTDPSIGDDPWETGSKRVKEYVKASDLKHWIRRQEPGTSETYAKKLGSRTIDAVMDLSKHRLAICKRTERKNGLPYKERRLLVPTDAEIPGEAQNTSDRPVTADVHG